MRDRKLGRRFLPAIAALLAAAGCFTTKNVNLDGGGPTTGGRDGGAIDVIGTGGGTPGTGGAIGSGGSTGSGGTASGGATGTGGAGTGGAGTGGAGTGGAATGGRGTGGAATGGTATGGRGTGGTGTGGASSGGSGTGGRAPDASTQRCDPTNPFGPPTVVPNVNTTSNDFGAELADDLTLYFVSDRPGGPGGADIYVATRSSSQSSFTSPQATLGINTPGTELWPRLTHDELTLYYAQYTPPASGRGDLYVTTRSSVTAAFLPGVALAQVNLASADDGDPFLWRDGEALYMLSNRPGTLGSYDIYVSARRTDGSYDTPQPVSEINSTGGDAAPIVTPDGLTIYWTSDRPDGGTPRGHEIWRATRSSISEPFGNLARVLELNSDYNESLNWISPDGCKIYLTTTRPGGPGGQDIWEASRPL